MDKAYSEMVEILKTKLGTKITDAEKSSKLDAIINLLGQPASVRGETDVVQLRQKFEELGDLSIGLLPGTISKLKGKTVGSNARETIKKLITPKGHDDDLKLRTHIMPAIDAYLEAQSRIMEHRIAYQNAIEEAQVFEKMQAELRRIQDEYPNAQLEMLELQRHEHCSNFNKGAGLNSDAGLDALHIHENLAGQSLFSLKAIQGIQTKQMQFLKELGCIDTVDMTISNVTRAHETAANASVHASELDSRCVSSYMGEKQYALSVISSGRAMVKPSEIAAKLDRETPGNFKTTTSGSDALILSEDSKGYAKRRSHATSLVTRPQVHKKTNGVSVRVAVFHAAHGREVLSELANAQGSFEHTGVVEKPEKLDFGSKYRVFIIRNGNQILKTMYAGAFTNTGRPQAAHNLKELKDAISTRKLGKHTLEPKELGSLLLNEYCFKETSVPVLIETITEHADLMIDRLSAMEFQTWALTSMEYKNPERTRLVLDTLANTAIEELEILSKNPKKKFTLFAKTNDAVQSKIEALLGSVDISHRQPQ